MFLIFSCSLLFGTTYHTITVDGSNDFVADETFSTSSSGFYGYITWDSSNLYIGMEGDDVPWADGGSEKVIFIYY